MGELWRIGTKAQLLQIERVQCLLEVSLHRDREHRLVEVDRLAHQGKTSTCNRRDLENLRELQVGAGGLVDEQVLSRFRSSVEYLRSQQWGQQSGARSRHRWIEKRGN